MRMRKSASEIRWIRVMTFVTWMQKRMHNLHIISIIESRTEISLKWVGCSSNTDSLLIAENVTAFIFRSVLSLRSHVLAKSYCYRLENGDTP